MGRKIDENQTISAGDFCPGRTEDRLAAVFGSGLDGR
jgi:hypothetical protein